MKYLLPFTFLFLGTFCRAEDYPEQDPLIQGELNIGSIYKNVGEFIGDVKGSKLPWTDILRVPWEPPGDFYTSIPLSQVTSDRYTLPNGTVAPLYSGTNSVQVLAETDHHTLVIADGSLFRQGFCTGLFLFKKEADHVVLKDFIRRTDLGYSEFYGAEVLPLEPRKETHLKISYYRGGRRWGFDFTELFIIKDDAFQPTLALRSGCGLQFMGDYHDISQEAKFVSKNGKLVAEVQRYWMLKKTGDEHRSSFRVKFIWDPEKMKFISPDLRHISLHDPEMTPPRNGPFEDANVERELEYK